MAKGLATWLGVILTLGQYTGAVAIFLASAHDDVAIGALGTATATAIATILGRMYQGAKAIEASPLGKKWARPEPPALSEIADEIRYAVQAGAELERGRAEADSSEAKTPHSGVAKALEPLDKRDEDDLGEPDARELEDDDDDVSALREVPLEQMPDNPPPDEGDSGNANVTGTYEEARR